MDNQFKGFIREAVMRGNTDEIRGLLLTDNQIRLIRMVSDAGGYFTSQELSIKYKISIQNASLKLKRLCDAGYIEKLSVNAESGGIEYHYKGYYKTPSNRTASSS